MKPNKCENLRSFKRASNRALAIYSVTAHSSHQHGGWHGNALSRESWESGKPDCDDDGPTSGH